jgi:transposase-like protein
MTTKSKGSEFWAGHVEAARQSGATLVAYAREHGLSSHTMRNWRRKLKAQTGGVGAARAEARPTAFVALKVATPALPHCGAVTLAIGSDVRLQMNELPPPAWLAEIGLAMRGAR